MNKKDFAWEEDLLFGKGSDVFEFCKKTMGKKDLVRKISNITKGYLCQKEIANFVINGEVNNFIQTAWEIPGRMDCLNWHEIFVFISKNISDNNKLMFAEIAIMHRSLCKDYEEFAYRLFEENSAEKSSYLFLQRYLLHMKVFISSNNLQEKYQEINIELIDDSKGLLKFLICNLKDFNCLDIANFSALEQKYRLYPELIEYVFLNYTSMEIISLSKNICEDTDQIERINDFYKYINSFDDAQKNLAKIIKNLLTDTDTIAKITSKHGYENFYDLIALGKLEYIDELIMLKENDFSFALISGEYEIYFSRNFGKELQRKETAILLGIIGEVNYLKFFTAEKNSFLINAKKLSDRLIILEQNMSNESESLKMQWPNYFNNFLSLEKLIRIKECLIAPIYQTYGEKLPAALSKVSLIFFKKFDELKLFHRYFIAQLPISKMTDDFESKYSDVASCLELYLKELLEVMEEKCTYIPTQDEKDDFIYQIVYHQFYLETENDEDYCLD